MNLGRKLSEGYRRGQWPWLFLDHPWETSIISERCKLISQFFEKVQWNIPRQVNLSCLNTSICVYIYIIYEYTCDIYIYVPVCVRK